MEYQLPHNKFFNVLAYTQKGKEMNHLGNITFSSNNFLKISLLLPTFLLGKKDNLQKCILPFCCVLIHWDLL